MTDKSEEVKKILETANQILLEVLGEYVAVEATYVPANLKTSSDIYELVRKAILLLTSESQPIRDNSKPTEPKNPNRELGHPANDATYYFWQEGADARQSEIDSLKAEIGNLSRQRANQ